MPVLDLDEFLTAIIQNDGRNTVSLLLFQAVMFASITFVDSEYLTAYTSRRAARKTFFERIRLLYGLGCESNQLSMLQALLLMTYWYEGPDDEKDTWYWMGIGLSLAQVLGMHRNPEHLGIPLREKRLRKRIWWSCFMRDRLLALGIRRPARIRSEDFTVPMLTIEDFDLSHETLVQPLHLATDMEFQKTMAIACIELSRLCVHIGHILLSQYSILGNSQVGVEESVTMMVMPRKSVDQVQEMAKCDVELGDWYQNLNPRCHYSSTCTSFNNEKDECRSILYLYQAMLQMIYLTALTVLHRPRAMQSSSHPAEKVASMRMSRERVSEAVVGITELVYDLHLHNQLRYLSTTSIPAILSATLVHLIDIRSSKEEIRNSAIGRFYQCWQSLQQLRDMYASADHAVWFLEAVIQKMNIQIPMLNIGSGLSTSREQLINTLKPSSIEKDSRLHQERPRQGSRAPATPSSFGDQSTDTTNRNLNRHRTVTNTFTEMRPSSEIGDEIQPSMGDSSNVDQYGCLWTDYDREDNLLRALINFDADPACFL